VSERCRLHLHLHDTERSEAGEDAHQLWLQLLALDWPPTSPTGPLGCLLFSGARLSGAALFGLSYSSGQGFNLRFFISDVVLSSLDSEVLLAVAAHLLLGFLVEVPQQDVPGLRYYHCNSRVRFSPQ